MNLRSLTKFAVAFFLVLTFAFNAFAQYRGAPVKKERLVKALRSKQFQTRDIVTIINTNGVDFALTPEIRQLLIAAGARPEVIKAVADNPRLSANPDGVFARSRKATGAKTTTATYDDLLDQAMFAYKSKKDSQNAVRVLESAISMNPKNPAAYQMLGFVNLYGLNNLAEGEKMMRKAIENGGSAVLRVYHDDSGGFSQRCSGSLYISPDSIRFESDDNLHTFETSVLNVDKFRFDTETNREWKKHSVFNVLLKIGREKAKFRFAPVTGREAESKMAQKFVIISKISPNVSVSTTGFAS